VTLLLDVLLKDKLVTSKQIDDVRDKRAGVNKAIYEGLIDVGFFGVRKFKMY
jgi:hypothetical protein